MEEPKIPTNVAEIFECEHIYVLEQLIQNLTLRMQELEDYKNPNTGRFSHKSVQLLWKSLKGLRASAYVRKQNLQRKAKDGSSVLGQAIQLMQMAGGNADRPALPAVAVDFSSKEMQLAKETAIRHMNRSRHEPFNPHAQITDGHMDLKTGSFIPDSVDTSGTEEMLRILGGPPRKSENDLSSVPMDTDLPEPDK